MSDDDDSDEESETEVVKEIAAMFQVKLKPLK